MSRIKDAVHYTRPHDVPGLRTKILEVNEVDIYFERIDVAQDEDVDLGDVVMSDPRWDPNTKLWTADADGLYDVIYRTVDDVTSAEVHGPLI